MKIKNRLNLKKYDDHSVQIIEPKMKKNEKNEKLKSKMKKLKDYL
jgi:hypothetical protein